MNDVICDVCGKNFNSKSNLRKHKNDVHSFRRFQCSICGFACPTNYKLQLHKAKHSDERPFICDCSKSFKTKGDLQKHQKTHMKGPFNCSHCNQIFGTRKEFELHNKSINAANKTTLLKIHKCHICNKVFSDTSTLKRHNKSFHEKTAQIFECECGKTYTQRSDLKQHQLRKHTTINRNSFECSFCSKSFNLKSDLKFHLETHNRNLENGKFGCVTCNINFPGRSLMEEHFITVHPEEYVEDLQKTESANTLTCNVCQKRFTNLNNLNKHRNFVHFRVGVCYCDFCMKRFARKATLKTHFNTCPEKLARDSKKISTDSEIVEELENSSGFASSITSSNSLQEHLSCDIPIPIDIILETKETGFYTSCQHNNSEVRLVEQLEEQIKMWDEKFLSEHQDSYKMVDLESRDSFQWSENLLIKD